MGITNKFYSKVSLHADRLSRITLDSTPRRYSRWYYDYTFGSAKLENVVATQNGNDVDITWTPRSADFVNYYVYASDDGGINFSLIATVTDETLGSATYSDPGEGQYSFYVIGENSDGGLSLRSDIASLYVNLAPSDPSNLAVNAINEQAVLTWDASIDQNLDEYIIKLDGVEVDRVSAGATLQHTYTNLTNGSTYTFGVQAIDALGATSNTTTIIETVADTIAPAVPTGLSATAGPELANATWDANAEPDIAGYNVYADGVKNNGSLIAGTSYTATGLTADVPTDIQVSAVDTAGNESALSSPVTVTPEEASSPTNFAVAPITQEATWDALTGVDGYNVYLKGGPAYQNLVFNGTDQYLSSGITTYGSLFSEMTIEFDLINSESSLRTDVMGTADDGANMILNVALNFNESQVYEANKLFFQIRDLLGNQTVVATTNAHPELSDGNKHRISISKDSSNNVSMYIDGVSVGVTVGLNQGSTSFGDFQYPLHMGANNGRGTANRFLNGKLADVRLWSIVRTTAQIDNNKNVKLVGDETNLYAYYPMYAGSGDTVTDYAGSNNGTLVNNVSDNMWVLDPDDTSTTYVKQNESLLSSAKYQFKGLPDGSYEAYATSETGGLESDPSNTDTFNVT